MGVWIKKFPKGHGLVRILTKNKILLHMGPGGLEFQQKITFFYLIHTSHLPRFLGFCPMFWEYWKIVPEKLWISGNLAKLSQKCSKLSLFVKFPLKNVPNFLFFTKKFPNFTIFVGVFVKFCYFFLQKSHKFYFLSLVPNFLNPLSERYNLIPVGTKFNFLVKF